MKITGPAGRNLKSWHSFPRSRSAPARRRRKPFRHRTWSRSLPTLRANATWPITRWPPTDATRRDFSSGSRPASITALTIRDLADYVAWLHGRKLSPTSIARHIASLKVFFRYLQLEGVLVESQAELLGSQKLWERVPKVLSPAQVNRLFETPKPGDLCWRRDRALLELLYATGCRASETIEPETSRRASRRSLLHLPRQRR